jgi:hypothetical protein
MYTPISFSINLQLLKLTTVAVGNDWTAFTEIKLFLNLSVG